MEEMEGREGSERERKGMGKGEREGLGKPTPYSHRLTLIFNKLRQTTDSRKFKLNKNVYVQVFQVAF